MSGILPKDIIKRSKGGAFGNLISDWTISNISCSHRLNLNMATHYDLIKMLLCLEIWHKIYIESDDICKPKLVMSDFY